MVLIDGDCIPSRHFVRDHMEWAEPGRYACGRRVMLSQKERGMWGCNAGVWMSDLVRVNGFNNEFEGWGHEDVDLERRLLAVEVLPKALRGMGAVYHLYHPSNSSLQNEPLWTMGRRQAGVEVSSGLRECMAED